MTPTRQPRRRWYHRYAIVEESLLLGKRSLLSWHLSKTGAEIAVGQLVAHYWTTEPRGRYVTDVFDWRALRADHFLVQEVVSSWVTP